MEGVSSHHCSNRSYPESSFAQRPKKAEDRLLVRGCQRLVSGKLGAENISMLEHTPSGPGKYSD